LAPQHPDLAKLERQAQRLGTSRAEKARELAASAQEALNRNDLSAAQQAVHDAMGIDAKQPEAVAAREQVEAREREAAGTRRADDLAAEARRLLEEGKLEESEARQAELRELMPAHPQLGPLRIRLQGRRNDPELVVRN